MISRNIRLPTEELRELCQNRTSLQLSTIIVRTKNIERQPLIITQEDALPTPILEMDMTISDPKRQ